MLGRLDLAIVVHEAFFDALRLLLLHTLLELSCFLLLLLLAFLELNDSVHPVFSDLGELLLSIFVFFGTIFVSFPLHQTFLLANSIESLVNGIALRLLSLLQSLNVCLYFEFSGR